MQRHKLANLGCDLQQQPHMSKLRVQRFVMLVGFVLRVNPKGRVVHQLPVVRTMMRVGCRYLDRQADNYLQQYYTAPLCRLSRDQQVEFKWGGSLVHPKQWPIPPATTEQVLEDHSIRLNATMAAFSLSVYLRILPEVLPRHKISLYVHALLGML